MASPKPIRTKVHRDPSLPEMVSTPSDIGIWEVAHDLPKGKWEWKRLFQDPRTYTFRKSEDFSPTKK